MKCVNSGKSLREHSETLSVCHEPCFYSPIKILKPSFYSPMKYLFLPSNEIFASTLQSLSSSVIECCSFS